MEARLLGAALARRRTMVVLAIVAVAIGASVASALLHVSSDVSRKLSRELRSLGPNLLVVPTDGGFLDAQAARARVERAGLAAVPLLYVVARVNGEPLQVIGADLAQIARLHPGWKLADGDHPSLAGERLMDRLGISIGDRLSIEGQGTAALDVTVGARLEAGGANDEALWIPLSSAQALGPLAGRASLVQARVDGGLEQATAAERLIERGGGLDCIVLHELSATEGGLLERMRRLMMLVTLAALLAAGLCALGTLTDLALERRRDIALMKALGAGNRDVAKQFAAESLVIGLAGGVIGWGFGLLMAQVIGSQVFRSGVALRWDVPVVVLALSLLVALAASLGPIRLAHSIEPAATLKGE